MPDTTTLKVERILTEAARDAYDFHPFPGSTADEPCGCCGHRAADHVGEEWEGPCSHDGCACAARQEPPWAR